MWEAWLGISTFKNKKGSLELYSFECTHTAEWIEMNFCIICSRMYQDKLASLKRQLQQLHEGNHCSHKGCSSISCSAICFVVRSCWWPWKDVAMCRCIFFFFSNYLFIYLFIWFTGTLQEYQRRMKKLDQQYKERLRNAGKPRKFRLRFHADASMLSLFAVSHHELGVFAALPCQAWVRE